MTSALASDPRLDTRVLELLAAHSGRLAFNGLRRTLGAHPETLARALRRLERDGLIVRADGGYRIRDGIDDGLVDRPAAPPAGRTLASVELPPGSSPDDVLGRLAGRWFGRLRWVGVYERPGAPELVWSLDDGRGSVRLGFDGRTLQVRIDEDAGSAPDELERAGQELLVQALTRLRSTSDGPRTVAELRGDVSPAPWGDN